VKRRRVLNGICGVAALLAIGIPLQHQTRQLQLDSDLRAAIQQDKSERVKALLAQGSDPNAIGPAHGSVVSLRKQIDRLFGRSKAYDSASALAVAIGMNLSGDFDPTSTHWNPAVISALLSHGAVVNPKDPRHPWGDLKGWTLDNSGFGMAYTQHFNFPPGSHANPIGVGHMYFQKHDGITIISAFRKAGLKGG
jgi:hypothetical protein